MYNCPSCGKENTEQKTVCDCGVDLTLLECIESLADSWFNQALDAAKSGEYGKAVELLSACCITKPSDVEALKLRAKVWLGLGCKQEAKRSYIKALEIDPDCAELKQLGEIFNKPDKSPDKKKKKTSAKTGHKSRK
jgi:tetratricopeptide (TPR) repeat protein